MAFTAKLDSFRFPSELAKGVAGKRVLITGSGKDGGLLKHIRTGAMLQACPNAPVNRSAQN